MKHPAPSGLLLLVFFYYETVDLTISTSEVYFSVMGKKRNKRDAAALIARASLHLLAEASILSARRKHPDEWLRYAIRQLAVAMEITGENARALISEHCTVKTN